MARKRLNWGNVVEGEVVTFRYKGKKADSKSRVRTCLILNTRHMYKRLSDGKKVRLVHALQLKAVPKKPGTRDLQESQLKKVLNRAGKVTVLGEGTDEQRFAIKSSRAGAQKQYNKIRSIVEQFAIYRTFSWEILRRNAVFLDEEFTWPEELVSEYQKQPPVIDEDDLQKWTIKKQLTYGMSGWEELQLSTNT